MEKQSSPGTSSAWFNHHKTVRRGKWLFFTCFSFRPDSFCGLYQHVKMSSTEMFPQSLWFSLRGQTTRCVRLVPDRHCVRLADRSHKFLLRLGQETWRTTCWTSTNHGLPSVVTWITVLCSLISALVTLCCQLSFWTSNRQSEAQMFSVTKTWNR